MAAEACHNTIVCIVTGGRLGHWVVSRDRRDMAGGGTTIRRRELRYARQRARGHEDKAYAAQRATWPGQACDTVPGTP